MKTIGVIGLGSIGLRHAKNLIAMGHKVIGYDPDPSAQHELLIAGGELSEAIYPCGMGVEAVVIASPTSEHYNNIYQCLSRNFPAIFVEKPFIHSKHNISEAENWLALARKRGQVVMTGHNLRFHPLVIKAKRWMFKCHEPTRAKFVVAQRSTKPAYFRDGVTLNWAIHEIDLALYLLGPAKVTAAHGTNIVINATLEHDNGCITTIYADYITDPEVREFHIGSDDSGFKANLVSPAETWDEVYKREMEWFLDSIDKDTVSGTPYYGASGYEGLEAVKIALDIQKLAGL